VILLESIKDNVLEHLQTNHRVQVIYSREALTCVSNHLKLHRIINKQLQQFTLDLTADIVHFFTIEGEKQAKLERLDLTRIYYRKARFLKEWAMAFVKV
jgi:predicted aldo/keto reductase-like oxidoreductase